MAWDVLSVLLSALWLVDLTTCHSVAASTLPPSNHLDYSSNTLQATSSSGFKDNRDTLRLVSSMSKDSISAICHAQCVTRCEDYKLGIGPVTRKNNKASESTTLSSVSTSDQPLPDRYPEEECLEQCDKFSSPEWIEYCGYDECCIETCMYMRDVEMECEQLPDLKMLVPEMDEEELKLEETQPPYHYTLDWKEATMRINNNHTIVYVVEQRVITGAEQGEEDWEVLDGTKETFFLIEMGDVCAKMEYRVAAVNQFGSDGFTSSVPAEVKPPGKVTRVETENELELRKSEGLFYYSFTFETPDGWEEDDIRDYLFRGQGVETQCSYECRFAGPPPPVPIIEMTRGQDSPHHVSMKIGVVNSDMCVYTCNLYADARCQGMHGEKYPIIIDINCENIENHPCEYENPGSVHSVTATVTPNSMNVSVVWHPPDNLGTASYIHEYLVHWGPTQCSYWCTTREEGRLFVSGQKNKTYITVLQQNTEYGLKVIPIPPPHEHNMTEKEINDTLGIMHIQETFEIFDTNTDNEHRMSTVFGDGFVNITGDGAEEKVEGMTSETEINPAYIILPVSLVVIVTIVVVAIVYRRRVKSKAKANHPWDLADTSNYKTFMLQKQVDGCLIDNPFYVPQNQSKAPLLDEWEVPRACLVLGEVLGVGAFGQVVRGTMDTKYLRHRVRGKMSITSTTSSSGDASYHSQNPEEITVAVKMLLGISEDTYRHDFLKEIELMKSIGPHPHIVSIIGCCTITEPLCLIVEHVPHGDLLHYLRRHRQLMTEGESSATEEATRLSLQDLLSFARQITVGMEFLSQKGFVHRDLATRNILVGEAKTVKIGDFGLTRYIYDDKVYVTRKGGKLPLKWMAIESIFDLTFTSASDVWAFGVVVFELITLGGTPYPTIPNKDLLQELKAGYRMGKPDNCSPELYKMMCDCWQENPKERPTFTSLRNQLDSMLEVHSSVDYLNFDLDESRDYYRSTTDETTAGEDDVFRSESQTCTDSGAASGGSDIGRLTSTDGLVADQQSQLSNSASSGIVVDCRKLRVSTSDEDNSAQASPTHLRAADKAGTGESRQWDTPLCVSPHCTDGLLSSRHPSESSSHLESGWIGDTDL